MQIIEAKERSTVALPLDELLRDASSLRLRPDLIGRGLVEIRQRGDTLTLGVNGVIGQIPITDELVLDVSPKFPVSNLNELVYGAGNRARTILDWNRPYASHSSRNYLPIPLIRSFTKELKLLFSSGLHREYFAEQVSSGAGAKINFSRSFQKHWSRMQPTKVVLDRYSFSNDHSLNRLLKTAILSALNIAKRNTQLDDCVALLIDFARRFSNIKDLNPQSFEKITQGGLKVPSHRSDYYEAVGLALDIVQHVDFSLELAQRGKSLESFIISLDDVFEQYIRNNIRFYTSDNGKSITTLDGNINRFQKNLFQDNTKYKAKPDLIIKEDGQTKIIGDVKYKKKAKEEDRYQIISHALSYGVSKAMLIYPKPSTSADQGLQLIGSIGPITLYHYFYDLAANLELENTNLKKVISDIAAD